MWTGQSLPQVPHVACLSADGHHAGGKDAHAPVAGGADQLEHDTRAEVAEQGECGVCVCVSVCTHVCKHVCIYVCYASMSMHVNLCVNVCIYM